MFLLWMWNYCKDTGDGIHTGTVATCHFLTEAAPPCKEKVRFKTKNGPHKDIKMLTLRFLHKKLLGIPDNLMVLSCVFCSYGVGVPVFFHVNVRPTWRRSDNRPFKPAVYILCIPYKLCSSRQIYICSLIKWINK